MKKRPVCKSSVNKDWLNTCFVKALHQMRVGALQKSVFRVVAIINARNFFQNSPHNAIYWRTAVATIPQSLKKLAL